MKTTQHGLLIPEDAIAFVRRYPDRPVLAVTGFWPEGPRNQLAGPEMVVICANPPAAKTIYEALHVAMYGTMPDSSRPPDDEEKLRFQLVKVHFQNALRDIIIKKATQSGG